MRNLPKTMLLTCALAAMAFVLPTAAHAGEGAVKVFCGNNNCDLVTLGQICDTFALNSEPVAVSCENVASPGLGTVVNCGGAQAGSQTTCTALTLTRNQTLGADCFASPTGGINDAVVTCDTTPEAFRASDEAAGEDPKE